MASPLPDPLVQLSTFGVVRYAVLWQIERRDATILRLTDHDKSIVFNGQTYQPMGSFNASARQKLPNLEARNMELIGFFDSSAITHDDLRAGKYRDAKITERLVDWMFPNVGAIQTNVFWITDVSFDGENWTANVQGISRRMSQKIGRLYSRVCDYVLGDAKCTVNLTSFTFTGKTVTAIKTQKLAVETDLTQANDYFKYGKITWTSGLNAGLISEVKDYKNANGRVEFALKTVFNITVGDVFTAVRGCNKLSGVNDSIGDCRNVFSNVVNFGGQPFIPGTDKLLNAPNRKR